MKVKIYYKIGDYEDYVVLEEDTIEEIRIKAREYIDTRNPRPEHYWSELIS
jgi:hypothetical protein